MTIATLIQLFIGAGCERVYAKSLAENDNSKNQVYFGPGFNALTTFPNHGVEPHPTSKGLTFRARTDFSWMSETGALARAPGAQLILYAQYPEVRFSGFLKGCNGAPSELYNKRLSGRVLFLGVTSQRQIIGFTAAGGSELAGEFGLRQPTLGVFVEIPLPIAQQATQRAAILAQLCRIHNLGWIRSKRLNAAGQEVACESENCGGYTLEAELGIRPNANAAPDFAGFEVKQHRVSRFGVLGSARITLMTPEPNGGIYRGDGAEQFIRRYGKPAANAERWDFVGTHRFGRRHSSTKLTLALMGFDPVKQKITSPSGRIALVDDEGTEAASWGYAELMEHWARKHAHAVYVPCLKQHSGPRAYRYSSTVRLAQEPDFLRLLRAVSEGLVCYDPGIKLENAVTGRSRLKVRSQFRIGSAAIGSLYGVVESVNACNDHA